MDTKKREEKRVTIITEKGGLKKHKINNAKGDRGQKKAVNMSMYL